jgi:RNA polymerase sigma-70 factor (ECF subfamily)
MISNVSDGDRETAGGLVRRIMAREPGAEEELVRRYSRGIGILLRRMTDHRIAEDLHQETFRLALGKIRRGELREPEKLSGFMCGLARNLAIESLRQAHRTERLHDGETTLLIDSQPNPLALLLREESAAAIRQVLSELPVARDREILCRFYIAEEDKEQICADLGLSPLHFNRVLHRARERFRDLYQRPG